MKKIINGRKYDPMTAKQVGYYHNSYLPGHFYYFEERLYVKRNGEFFILGNGGLLSQYNVKTIVPITIDEAKAWAENHLDGDEYEAIFGQVEE